MSLEQGGAVRCALVLVVTLAACEPPGYGNRHHVEPDAAASHGDAPKSVDAASDAAGLACTQMFSLANYASASTVVLTGDWVMWAGTVQAGAIAMSNTNGTWSLSYGFARGTYQYKFVVDGSMWIADPGNPMSVDDGFGGKNSVYTCN